MSKIICEICGTVYPDNATQCPICGYPRKGEEKPETVEGEAGVAVAAAQSAERVKGGRFSNNNVKKRNQTEGQEPAAKPRRAPKQEPEDDGGKKSTENRGLLITVAVLLVAVILVGAYIGIRFFRGADAYDKAAQSSNAQSSEPSSEASSEPSTEPEDTGVACTNLVLSDSSVQFVGAGRAWLLSVTAVPADTTDAITYTSSDDSVATVTAEGRITSVGPGSCEITITCGSISKVCKVVCDFEEETQPTDETEASGETTAATTSPTETTQKEGFNLSHTDVTFSFQGDNFTFSAGKGISNAQVTWASSDASVAVVSSSGKVVAVGPGTAEITATYEGETQKCIIRCNFEADGTTATDATTATDGTVSTDTSWKISKEDVTISVGESFALTVTNDSGETASVTWSVGNSDYVSVSGNTVTGKASGVTTVNCTYNGTTFSCIVRVK